jgi:hypothetical protein
MKKILVLVIICFFISCSSQNAEQAIDDTLIVNRITSNEGLNNAFTDLTFFNNQFFLVFREADTHAYGKDGVIKLFNSLDGIKWTLIKEFTVSGMDLRDPKFSTNKNTLTLYIHGSKYENKKLLEFRDYISQYSESDGWLGLSPVFLDNLTPNTLKILGNEAWPWRVTWHNNKAYTVAYNGADIFDLYKSDDGIFFKNQKKFIKFDNQPSEATLRVSKQGEFFVLARRNSGSAIVGRSNDSGESWQWFGEIPFSNFRGPNFLLTDKNQIIFSGAVYGSVYLGLYDINSNTSKELLKIPSYGEGSYPGMVIKDAVLWLSYYTSYENTTGTSIYVSKINLKKLDLQL